jgi:hypothetical protein
VEHIIGFASINNHYLPLSKALNGQDAKTEEHPA